MSFKIRDLSVLAYANGFTMWHYKTTDAFNDTQTPGYFADASDMLTQGDIINISAAGGVGIRAFDSEKNPRPLL